MVCLLLFVYWNLFCMIMNICIKFVSETNNVSGVFFTKILSQAFYMTHTSDSKASLNYWLLWPMVRLEDDNTSIGFVNSMCMNVHSTDIWCRFQPQNIFQDSKLLGPLHVAWHISLGCWITWSVSNWHNPYNRVFDQTEFFGIYVNFISENLLLSQARSLCKMNPLNALRLSILSFKKK